MRPHALRLTAFGPFAGAVSVDLDALASSGLFLLHGPTGAGKTSLLDALGFALFGRVPGARNSAKRLRSDHALGTDRTQVQLVATLGGRRMRITRSPQQERAKSRGSGSTTEPAKVLLEEHADGVWVTVSTRMGEADAEIADLVGMSAEQFFQVVLLPQGDFAQFLRASSVDRAAVLQKLFATERFADVEAALVARRRATSVAADAARAAVEDKIARIAEVAGAALPERNSLSWATALLEQATAAEALAGQAVGSATVTRDARRVEAETATTLASRQSRRRAALLRREELARQQPELLTLHAELDAAARAAEVATALAQVTARRHARDDRLAAEAVARSALAGAGLEVDGTVAELREAAAAGRERSGRLEALRTVDAARQVALDEAAHARDDLADALAASSAAEVVLAALPAGREAVLRSLASARAAAEQVPAVRSRRDQLVSLRPDVVLLAQLEQRLDDLALEHLSARETALSLATKAADLRAASVNSMIARLAFSLEDDCPCPVCGSLAHPDKSQLFDEGVSSDDEDRARVAAEAAQVVVSDVEARRAADLAVATDLRARVGPATLAEVDAEVAALDLSLAVMAAEAARESEIEATLLGLDQQRVEATSAVVVAGERADACTRRAAEADLRASTALAQLAEALGTNPDLDAALRLAMMQVKVAETAFTATEAMGLAQQELDRALAEAQKACIAAGFASTQDAVAAQRTVDWRDTAASSVREAADTAAGVAQALADPELDVDLDRPAAVEAAAAALAEADVAVESAVGDLAQRRQRRTALERLLPELGHELDALRPLDVQAAEVRALADLCTGLGANTLKMTLTSFVLAARLEEVAAAASVRLLKMTQGRYALIHTDGAKGAGKSGLGLLARDGWSGQDRDTATLSGGETFLASLALALGLADVVSAEAGGSRIGALFVDEGFGTLDEDTLDEVMDVLDGLREGGRIVGLVSHVAELRQRIPAQLHVTKSRSGSDVTVVGC